MTHYHQFTEPRDQEPDDFELRLAATRAAIAKEKRQIEALHRLRKKRNAALIEYCNALAGVSHG